MKQLQPRTSPGQVRSQKRLELILATAQRLFLQNGVEETTTNDIAAAAKIPIGSVYRYFRNKNEIICALNARYVKDVRGLFESIQNNPLLSELSWEDIISALLSNWLQYCRTSKPYTALLFQRSSPKLQSQSYTFEYEIFGAFLNMVSAKYALSDESISDSLEDIANFIVLYKNLSGTVESLYELKDEDIATRVFARSVKLLAQQLEKTA